MYNILKNIGMVIITSVLISAIFSYITYDSFKSIITKENINKFLGEINIEELLTSQNVEYDEILNNYVNDTNLSKEDISKIFESDEYSKLVGNYMMDADMLDLSQYIDFNVLDDIAELNEGNDTDTNTNIEIDKLLTDAQIQEMFDKLNISYTKGDVNYFKNSITEEVAPEIQKKVANPEGKNQNVISNLKLDGITKLFSILNVNSFKITIVICVIVLIFINYQKFGFFINFAISTGIVGIIIRLLEFLISKLEEIIPNTYKSMALIFTKPLEEKLLHDFNVLMFMTIIFVVLNIIMNILLRETSLGKVLAFANTSNNKEESYKTMFEEFGTSNGNLADEIDLLHFDDDNEGTDNRHYDYGELKDITFSNDTYNHNDFN